MPRRTKIFGMINHDLHGAGKRPLAPSHPDLSGAGIPALLASIYVHNSSERFTTRDWLSNGYESCIVQKETGGAHR